MSTTFEGLPVELVAEILSELDIASLIQVTYLSRRLRFVASDPSLNPWRRPILRNLYGGRYEDCFKNLSVRTIVPRQNWVEVLSLAASTFLLYGATLPNLRAADWEECFCRRFLPGWVRWKKDGTWKEAFLKVLQRMWHRSNTSCTSDEAWTKYVVLNRSGSANELESSSRSFNPLVIFNEMKYFTFVKLSSVELQLQDTYRLQNNLAHLETRARLVVEFPDFRIIALGVLNRLKTQFTVNQNARLFLHPSGIEAGSDLCTRSDNSSMSVQSDSQESSPSRDNRSYLPGYERLTYPLPSLSHRNYPFYTPGGSDKRWIVAGALEEEGLEWVGGLMIVAQIIGPHTRESIVDRPSLQDMDLVTGPGRNQYASFFSQDLLALAPWMEEKITMVINGPSLGH